MYIPRTMIARDIKYSTDSVWPKYILSISAQIYKKANPVHSTPPFMTDVSQALEPIFMFAFEG